MNNSAKNGGVALVLFVLCFFATFALESTRESLGYPDADNPGVMMRFLNEHIDIFTFSGILFVLMGVLLTTTCKRTSRRAFTTGRGGGPGFSQLLLACGK